MRVSVQSGKKRPSVLKVKRVTHPKKKKAQKTYNVEKIISKRVINGKWEYFVKWMDFPESDNTWEPEVNFNLCRGMIDEYESQQCGGRTESVPTGINSRRPGPASATKMGAGSSIMKEENIKEAEVTKEKDDSLKLTDEEADDFEGVEAEDENEDENEYDLDDENTSLKEFLSESEDGSISDSDCTVEISPSDVPIPTAISWVPEMGQLAPVEVKGVLRTNTNELIYFLEMEEYPNKWIGYPASKAHIDFPELLVDYLTSRIMWVTREQQKEE